MEEHFVKIIVLLFILKTLKIKLKQVIKNISSLWNIFSNHLFKQLLVSVVFFLNIIFNVNKYLKRSDVRRQIHLTWCLILNNFSPHSFFIWNIYNHTNNNKYFFRHLGLGRSSVE